MGIGFFSRYCFSNFSNSSLPIHGPRYHPPLALSISFFSIVSAIVPNLKKKASIFNPQPPKKTKTPHRKFDFSQAKTWKLPAAGDLCLGDLEVRRLDRRHQMSQRGRSAQLDGRPGARATVRHQRAACGDWGGKEKRRKELKRRRLELMTHEVFFFQFFSSLALVFSGIDMFW